jgi:hypothetical protein
MTDMSLDIGGTLSVGGTIGVGDEENVSEGENFSNGEPIATEKNLRRERIKSHLWNGVYLLLGVLLGKFVV